MADYDDLNVKQRGLMKGSAFWGPKRQTFLFGELGPKKPGFGAGIVISSLNVESNGF
jgi:hypothetical protein